MKKMLRVKNVDKYEKNRVTVIIPVFNEKDYIDKIIKKIKNNIHFRSIQSGSNSF